MSFLVQVLVTHHSPLEVSGGDQLDRYTYKLQRGRKVDLTSKNGYLRGRWVTIMPTGTDFPMNLAEIRVYGSKCLILFPSKVLKFAHSLLLFADKYL